MLWLRLAYKEIRNNFRFSLFFILNLGIRNEAFDNKDAEGRSYIEDVPDSTKKVNASGKDMIISAMSQMTRRSRAVIATLSPTSYRSLSVSSEP